MLYVLYERIILEGRCTGKLLIYAIMYIKLERKSSCVGHVQHKQVAFIAADCVGVSEV